ncbi:cytochrome c [Aliiroseovarius sp. S1339]|uniref:c-type cytochrome n=1 Tax=Aliiroseovarius sp. S1339 TaxID=2936990 RepID=UPI0020BE05A8|nr:cytochrome c [Aliiroseovarius sp. S1339]MCK8465359.1 cytochrome c [Aliiroseovarius sp. S1339]
MRNYMLAGFAVGVLSIGTLALADGHITEKQLESATKARQAQMQLYSFNLGTLGAMAKEEVAYDSASAQTAADNLATLTSLSQAGYWLPGSDNESMEKTRALPAIWADGSEVGAKGKDFVDAVMAMQAAAGTDIDALKAAMGPLGAACSACHKDYRQSDD